MPGASVPRWSRHGLTSNRAGQLCETLRVSPSRPPTPGTTQTRLCHESWQAASDLEYGYHANEREEHLLVGRRIMEPVLSIVNI